MYFLWASLAPLALEAGLSAAEGCNPAVDGIEVPRQKPLIVQMQKVIKLQQGAGGVLRREKLVGHGKESSSRSMIS